MVTPDLNANTNFLKKRPFGIFVVESYFVTFIALISFNLIAALDVYTRRMSSRHLHFLQFFADPANISEIIICVLCVFAVVGLQRTHPRGRWLAIILASLVVTSVIWFISVVLLFRMWTLVSHQVWPNIRGAIKLGFGIYVIWYLFQPKTRLAFRQIQLPPAVESDVHT